MPAPPRPQHLTRDHRVIAAGAKHSTVGGSSAFPQALLRDAGHGFICGSSATGQDKLLLVYDLWFADFERLSPQDQQWPELQKAWFESRMMREQIAASRRLTSIRPEPVPRWLRPRLRATGRRRKSWSPRA